MTREDYRDRLAGLREAVVAMGRRVRQQLTDACSALFTADRPLANEVVAGDDAINDRYLELESECLDLLALYQPVAGDLRIVVAAFKIVTDLERIGDLATNLAEYALDATASTPPLPDADFERLTSLALEMLDRTLDAFADGNSAACFAVADRDAELDARCGAVADRVVRTLAELRLDGSAEQGARRHERGTRRAALADVSRTLVIVRDLERVGDHAVNVAARTLYALESNEALLR